MVEITQSFMDKVAAVGDSTSVDDEGDRKGLEWVEYLPEPPDDGGSVEWPMPEFCPLTIDGAVKESFLEMLRKEAELLRKSEQSPDSQPSSSKRHRPGGEPLPKSPYRNMLQVFQECKQDVA